MLFAGSYRIAGWSGPIVLASTCIAATFALLAWILGRRIPQTYAIAITLASLVLSHGHFLARPHVLVLPVMLAWAYGLMSASERREPPSFWLLPLMSLWANLHGGFVFGLALVGAFAIDALWNADAAQQRPLALRWALFGFGALIACCATGGLDRRSRRRCVRVGCRRRGWGMCRCRGPGAGSARDDRGRHSGDRHTGIT